MKLQNREERAGKADLQGGLVAHRGQGGEVSQVPLTALFQRLPALCATDAARAWRVVLAAVRCLGRVGRKTLTAVEYGFGRRHTAIAFTVIPVRVGFGIADHLHADIRS